MILVTTAEEMRALDEATIKGLGLPGVVLMEHAGFGVLEHTEDVFGPVNEKKMLVICGKGNNGGDGFVVARWAMKKGADVRVVLLTEMENLKGDALVNAQVFYKLFPERLFIVTHDLNILRGHLSWCEIVVDGILGTGLTSAVRGFFKEVIDAINDAAKPVVAIDIPSGLSVDTGKIMGSAIRASLTVTFGLPKVAHYTYPAAELVGKVRVVDIGIPRAFVEKARILASIPEEEDVATLFPPRPLNSHKGRYGHLMGITGSPGKTGAGIMTARSALRIGTGLVTMAVPASLNSIFENTLLEAMTLPLPDEDGHLIEEAAEDIEEVLEGKTALALGPGLGTHPSTFRLVRRLVEEVDIPMVMDADGVNALAGHTDILERREGSLILTPHPGEMSRLIGIPAYGIQQERLETAREFATRFGLILVLKGAGTATVMPDGRAVINTTGNPGMASGGSGDVLTGIIGGLLAMGVDPERAAWGGVYLHGLAGDEAAKEIGEYPLIAGDMIEVLPKIIKRWEDFGKV